jgi:hypothetical protein
VPPELTDFVVTEELRNTDLYAAVFLGVVAALFAIRAELREEPTMVETRWLRFAIVICAIIAVLLVLRIAVVTVAFFSLLLSHI